MHAPTKDHKVPIAYDKTLYRQRHMVENTFAKLKDGCRIVTRY
jgi:transposase